MLVLRHDDLDCCRYKRLRSGKKEMDFEDYNIYYEEMNLLGIGDFYHCTY